MIKKMILFNLIFIFTVISTGCWDHKEVNTLAIVVGLGIDKIPGSNPILLTAQIVNPSALAKEKGGGKGKPFIVATAEGKTIYDAVRNFALDSPRRFYFEHNSIIVIGEKMAQSGVQPLLDFFERDPEFRRTTWMMVTPKTAKEILESSLDLEKIPSIGVKGMIREFRQSSASKTVQRKEFVKSLVSTSSSAIASKLDLIGEEAMAERKLKAESGEEGGEEAKASGQGKKQLRLSGAALFNKDKLAGYMTDAETRGLLWILGEVKGGAVVAACPEDKKGNVVFNVKTSKTRIKPLFDRETLKLLIEIEEEGEIAEANCPELDLSKPETINKLEKLESKDIEDRVMESVRKGQRLKTDVFGFGEAFHRKDPKKWKEYEKEWEKHFPKIEVTVDVTAKIRRIGMSSKSVKIED